MAGSRTCRYDLGDHFNNIPGYSSSTVTSVVHVMLAHSHAPKSHAEWPDLCCVRLNQYT